MSPGAWRSAGAVAVLLAGIVVLIAVLGGGDSPDPGDRTPEARPCAPAGRDDGLSRQVRLATAGERIEFELWSSEPFPTRALFPVVRIGTRDFTRSSYGPDGNLHTLIFFIPQEEFDMLGPDDQVWVYYGGAGSPPPRDVVPDASHPWSFGAFDKGLLDCR